MVNPSNAPQATLLVIDDTPANVRLLERILTRRGYRGQQAPDGAQGIKNVQTDPPDLILLDIMMPVLNGYETCKLLKADPQTRHIPILFISSLDATEDKVRAFEVGGEDYVTKPFQEEEVLARVAAHLALSRLQKELASANQQLVVRLDELHQANLDLQDRNAELDAFAHTVAHDLKSPLGNIMGYAEFVASAYPDLTEHELRQSLQGMAQASLKMDNIIQELLLLSQVRKTEAQTARLDMAAVVAEALQRLEQSLHEQQADVRLPTDWPNALGHAPWIEQVWVNYISNAIKYGGQPPWLELGGKAGPDGVARFWVRDNGQGLTPEEQSQLFMPFTRLDQARAKGHGLGLSVVRRIVEKLGGQVGVDSQAGQGSTFYFTLPSN